MLALEFILVLVQSLVVSFDWLEEKVWNDVDVRSALVFIVVLHLEPTFSVENCLFVHFLEFI
jgi:hypothetical protein